MRKFKVGDDIYFRVRDDSEVFIQERVVKVDEDGSPYIIMPGRMLAPNVEMREQAVKVDAKMIVTDAELLVAKVRDDKLIASIGKG